MKKYKLWKILTIVFAFLTVVMIVANVVCSMYATTINWALNTVSSEVVLGDEPGPIYYESEFALKNSDGSSQIGSDGKEIMDKEALSAAGDAIVKEVAREGIALLKNDGALPLEKGASVSLFGQSVDKPVTSGSGSGVTASGGEHTYLSSLTNAGLEVNQASWNFYNSGAGASYSMSIPSMHGDDPFSINECPWSVVQSDSTYSQMINSDTAIVVFSRNGGEGFDLPGGTNPIAPEGERYTADGLSQADGSLTGGNFLELNADERSVLAGLKALKDNHTIENIVVVLNTPNAMELDFLSPEVCGVDYGVDACLWMGPVGQSGLAALGQVLTGYNGDEQFSPSGRLVDTYAYDNLREPSLYNYGESEYTNYEADYRSTADSQDGQQHLNQKYYTVYREGIYVGYRYHETRYEDYVFGQGNPTKAEAYDYSQVIGYSFGHGLSYTTFEYSDFAVTDNNDGTLTATVTVTNTGDWAGKEVVELYAQTPYTDYDRENGIEKASIELVGYDKTALLAPGASEEVTISVDKSQLTSYDSNNAKTYIMDAGDYYLTFGNGAHDALNAIIGERENVEGLTAIDERIVPASDPVNYSGSGRVFHWTEEFDAETYSTSPVTGAEITNQFDFADINKYSGKGDNSVEYVSRSDWMGTFDVTSLDTMKATTVQLSMTDQMFAEVTNTWYEPAADASSYTMPTMGASNGLTLAMFVGVPRDGSIELTDDAGVVHTYTWDDLFDQMTYTEMANLVLRGQHTTAEVVSVGKPSTQDENGPSGFNVTFGGGNVGSGTAHAAPVLRASTWNQELVQRVGELIGEDGRASNRNGIYGPAANTHRNAYGGRNFEYYSEDPFISSTIGASECIGIQSKGLIVYEKHFALNDGETHREGVGVWANEQTIREIYLEAFRGIMSADQGNAHATMSGFNRIGTKWCGASTELMNNVLRGEWGFDGFVATDMDNCNNGVLCTGYMYAPTAITGGTDIYDGVGNPAAHNRRNQLNAYRNDPYVMTKLREACEHIVYAVANSAAMNGVSADATIRSVTPWWQATLIAVTVVFGAVALGSVAMWVLNATHVIAFPKPKKDRESAENVSAGKE